MRIAHFIQRFPPALGGSEAYFARLGRHLAGHGDSVTVFTTQALDLDAFWSPRGRVCEAGVSFEAGVRVCRYPLWRMRGRRWLLKPLSLLPHRTWQCLTLPCNPIAPAMWREAGSLDEPYDLVHATAFPYAFPIACARRLARRLNVPFLVTPFLHLGDPDDPRDRTRRGYTQPALVDLLLSADGVFAQTDWERETLVELGVPAERVVLLGMGVEPAECTGGVRTFARQAWSVGYDEPVVGLLANQSFEKGSIDLLQAAQQLWQRGKRFSVVLAGPEMPGFRRFYRKFRPLGRVVRLGVVDDEMKRDFFAGIDVFALPSRSDSFGLVLLEAWANGVPGVAYRAGGPGQVIRHEEDGLLVPCGNIDALAASLQRLLDDEEERQRLGQAGHARIAREFLWRDKLETVRRVYAQATGQAEPKPSGVSSTK